jgi:hypothetical protein
MKRMGKFTFVVVFVMMALASGLQAFDDLEVAWQEYLVKSENYNSVIG